MLIILVLFFAGALAFVAYFIVNQIKAMKAEKDDDAEKMQMMMDWMKDLRTEMKESVDKSSETLEKQLKNQRDAMFQQTKVMGERLDNAAKVIGEVQKSIGGINEFGKDIKDLSNVLKSPKMRGGLGEQFLYEILSNSLPKDMYETQYRFRNGAQCDAIIFTDRGMIPIDSKFPMEQFKAMTTAENDVDRDKAKKEFVKHVKTRVDEIADKYILPEEGTTEQAVMYIPSENVYYELIVNTPDIDDYSKRRNVVLVSPNTFSYIMKTILVAFQQNELAKHADKILKALAGIKVEAEKFDKELNVLDGHINRTSNSMNNVKSGFGKLFGKIDSVQQVGGVEESPLLEGDLEE